MPHQEGLKMTMEAMEFEHIRTAFGVILQRVMLYCMNYLLGLFCFFPILVLNVDHQAIRKKKV
jgi:hypothetical protein